MAAESATSETLSIHLNRANLHSIELPASFATADSFIIELDNHGEAAHVHLRLDDALSEIASIPSSNHYVRPGATARVPVSVSDEGPIAGLLTVATAYGSQTEDVEITIEPTAGKERVEIDESLVERSGGTVESGSAGTPTPTPTNRTRQSASGGGRTGTATGVDNSMLLGGAALVILLGIALLFAPGSALLIGAVAVLAGLLVAGYLLLY